MHKPLLFDLTKQALLDFLAEHKQPKFRADQILNFAIQGKDFADMHTLPKALRELLAEHFEAVGVKIYNSLQSKIDETEKFLFLLQDGNLVEGVLMKYHYGYTLCISTQVGCRMGCKFCASTLGGCVRNLTGAEMLGEVIVANTHLGNKGKVGHIVLMGSGEALDNYDNTIAFLRMVHREDLLNISYRNISLSTCGLVPQMIRFMEEDIPLTLSISLHAPTNERRKEIMPIANSYSLPELMGAARAYVQKTGRRVIFEYAVMEGINSAKEDAETLAKLLKNMQCHVNVIPLNKVEERNLQAPKHSKINAFIETLEALGVSVSKRRSMGTDIEGACGQLRNKTVTQLKSQE